MRLESLLVEVGRRLAAARESADLTMNEVASRAGVSTRYLRMAESGQANLSLLKLAALARALRTPLGELCDLELSGVPQQRLALLGVRGCGKTTVGRALSQKLEIPFLELDALIERRADMSLGQIFTIHGEEYYRQLQAESLEEWLAQNGHGILATGGGIVSDDSLFDRLRSTCRTVWLKATAEDLWNRVLAQGDTRPMDDHPKAMQQLRQLLDAREPRYASADLTVDSSGLTPDQVADAIVEWVEA